MKTLIIKLLSMSLLFALFQMGCAQNKNADSSDTGSDTDSDTDTDTDSDTDTDTDSDTDADTDTDTDVPGTVADHNSAAAFDSIPTNYFDTIRSKYNIFYGHTSHGSQIVSGLELLEDENATLYEMPNFHETGGDLGHNGDISWVAPTETFLDANSEYNMVMWSWCGGCSDNAEEGINAYLNAMNALEEKYPAVTFIYMTGHLDGTGESGNLRAMNNLIRAYCEANDKILFDFADIESWDPEGNFYPDGSDDCAWCTTWCETNSGEFGCTGVTCAHSHCFNCYQKGKAWWWMVARLEGWTG